MGAYDISGIAICIVLDIKIHLSTIKNLSLSTIVDTPDGEYVDLKMVHQRVHGLIAYISRSPQRREMFNNARAYIQPDVGQLSLITEVDTRWNSTFFAFRRAVKLK